MEETTNMEQLPPPPYSETDIYSNAPTSPSVRLTPATSSADHLSIPQSRVSRTSSDNSIIYTPPDSPSGGSIHRDVEHASSAFAAADAYFDSRPATAQIISPPTVHSIAITAATKPENLQYPEPIEDFLAKDVKPEDWSTFVNYLLPDYYSNANNDVADRKLKAELIDERMHRLTLDRNDVSRTDLDQVRAQLQPLRNESPRRCTTQADVNAMIDVWNEGFFLPRGIKIRLVASELAVESELRGVQSSENGESSTMPGAWIPYDHELPGGTAVGSRTPRRGWSFGGIRADSMKFKMGPIEADNTGLRMGNMLIADQNGFRFGKDRFVADHNGLTIGGRSFGWRECHEPEGQPRRRDVVHHSNRRGVNNSHMQHDHCGYVRGRGKQVHRDRHQHDRSHSHGRHRRRRGRDSSTSSSSSSSRSSSADSQSSIESLPEYDDLLDQQLYNARKALLDWLNHPEQPITRQAVWNIKEDIKSIKTISPKVYDEDLKILRKEVKDLMKKFREKKRTQRNIQRELKKEKRAAKRAAKIERRLARREARRGKRAEKGKFKAKDEACNVPSGMKMPATSTVDYRTPPVPYLTNPEQSSGQCFPFVRAASAPMIQSPPSDRPGAPPALPGPMHVGWSVLQQGDHRPVVEFGPGGFPASISHSAADIHYQAMQMDLKAVEHEKRAIDLRTEATGHDVPESVRVAKKQAATALEEVAEVCRMEAERLGAEGLLLDEELARELSGAGEGLQETGIVQSH